MSIFLHNIHNWLSHLKYFYLKGQITKNAIAKDTNHLNYLYIYIKKWITETLMLAPGYSNFKHYILLYWSNLNH